MRRGNHNKKSLWTEEEDKILVDYIRVHGKGRWNSIAKKTGLKRCGKSCRLRWMNYLSPSVKLGEFTKEEEDLIIRLHKLLGNRWSLIAGRVPGRTDNQVKNYWNTHLCRKVVMKKENSKVDHVSTTANSRSIEESEPQRTSKLNLFSGSSSVNEPTPIAVEVSDMRESVIGTECYANSLWVSCNDFELASPDFNLWSY